MSISKHAYAYKSNTEIKQVHTSLRFNLGGTHGGWRNVVDYVEIYNQNLTTMH